MLFRQQTMPDTRMELMRSCEKVLADVTQRWAHTCKTTRKHDELVDFMIPLRSYLEREDLPFSSTSYTSFHSKPKDAKCPYPSAALQ